MNSTATPARANSPERAKRTSTTLEVEIFGEVYAVRSDRDADHVLALAELVDQKMREIASKTAAVETSRIAILAALNIADELARERERNSSSVVPVAELANGLLDQLEGVLSTPVD